MSRRGPVRRNDERTGRKGLTTTTFVSVDGVMQGIGSPDEDRTGGFTRGGRTTPPFDDDTGKYLTEIYRRADAFLFGRRTYEISAGSWGAVSDPSMNAVAESLRSRPKYVASTTLTEAPWANTTVLSGDVAAAVEELRAERGGELLVPGSGALIRWLLARDLVDRMDLVIFPRGRRAGHATVPRHRPGPGEVDLVESRVTPRGVTIQVYRPAGRVQVGTSTADLRHVG